jgi:hypothetical protein
MKSWNEKTHAAKDAPGTSRVRLAAAFVVLSGVAITAPPATAGQPGPPNAGLVNALDSVGESLFGDAVFGASEITFVDGAGNTGPAVQMDLNDATGFPAIFNVFTAAGPLGCQTYFQVEVSGSGVVLRADTDAAPGAFDPVIEFVSLAAVPPSPIVEGGTGVETQINRGLVQALSSVGGGLFGSAAFAVSSNPGPPTVIDFLDVPPNPIVFDVFEINPGPPVVGAAYFQAEVSSAGVFLRADMDAAPSGFVPVLQFVSLAGSPPAPCAQGQR